MTSHPVREGTAEPATVGTDARAGRERAASDRAVLARAALARAEQRTGARRWSAPSVDEAAVRTPPTAKLVRGAAVRSGAGAHRSTGTVVHPVVDPGRERPPLPVPVVLTSLLPGGLPRGGTTVVAGSTSLLLALVSEASRAGSWVAMVGLPGVGLLAAEEVGVALARLALVPAPGAQAAVVVAALIDGMDVIVLGPEVGLTGADRRRLMARARERGSVMVSTTSWPGASLVLTVEEQQWSGLGEGDGRLRAQRVTVRRNGRGRAAAPLRREIVLHGGSVPAGARVVTGDERDAPRSVGPHPDGEQPGTLRLVG